MKQTLKNVCRLIAFSVALCSGLSGCGVKSGSEPSSAVAFPSVQTITVSTGTLLQSLPITGTLGALPQNQASLVPQVSGTLQAVFARIGQAVQKGDIIAQISPQQVEQQILQARTTLAQDVLQVQQAQANALQQESQTRVSILQAIATFRSAQALLSGDRATLTGDVAALNNAQKGLDRQQTLYGEGLVAQKDVESAQLDCSTAQSAVEAQKQQIEGQEETVEAQQAAVTAARTATLQDLVKRKDIQVAEQQVANAQSALAMTTTEASFYTIRSPLGGQVTFIGASPGESVDTSTKLATVANLSKLQLLVGIPSASAAIVHQGQKLTFSSDQLPGTVFSTTVESVSPMVDPMTGTVPAFAEVDNRTGALKDNTTVTGSITEGRRLDVILVPQSAVLSDPDTGAKTAAVIDESSVLHMMPVITGIEENGMVQIVSGISPGQRVATSGAYGLTDGTKVSVMAGTVRPDGP